MHLNTNDLINDGNLCAIPWLHAQFHLQQDTVTPCCKYNDSLGSGSNFLKYWHSDELKKLKHDIVNKIPHEKCVACNVPDNVFSYRAFKNIEFTKNMIVSDLDSEDLPQVLNFGLKNTCNLACRMCSPLASSKLHEIAKKNTFLTEKYRLSTMKSINNNFDVNSLKGIFKNVKHVTLSGGEPLIDDDCYHILKLIKEESNSLRSITFSTNFTKPKKSIIDLVKTLDCVVQMNISIDGPPHIHDYIRYGCDFNNIIENINSNKNFRYGINSTISAINVGYLPELLDSLVDLSNKTGIKLTHVMSSPVLENHLHAGNLPTNIKSLYREKLNAHTNKLDCKGSDLIIKTGLNLMSNDLPNWELTKKFLTEFDSVTNTSYQAVYPEFD